MWMKALTVRQQFAGLVVDGVKTVENRSWRTDYRGVLLVHAGLSRADLRARLPKGIDPPSRPVFGALVGVVEVADCVPWSARLGSDVWARGPGWCWLLTNAKRFARAIP